MKSIDADKTVRNNYKTIIGLCTQSISSELRAPEMRAGILKELCMFIEIQEKIEINILYPSLLNSPNGETIISLCTDELNEIASYVRKVRQSPAFSEHLDDLLNELFDSISIHHSTLETQL